jgi:type I restriction enzyme M protein
MQSTLPLTSGLSNEDKAKLWAAADKLRGHMDAAEYKHIVLGLIFLKYISDAFEEHYAELDAQRDEGVDPEDKDEYTAEGIFWVPPDARWSRLKDNREWRSTRG